MKYAFSLLLILVLFTACKTVEIKDEIYKVSATSPEIGSIGQSKSLSNTHNDFTVKTFPELHNNIRVAVEAVPFNNKLYGIYKKKKKFNQKQAKLNYIDSLPSKPELITIRLIDVVGFVNELNAEYNDDVYRYVKDSESSKIVTSIAVSFSDDEIEKIRQADTYYLSNSQNSKFTLSLYKLGKKTETIHIIPQDILAYRLSKICWAINQKKHWHIADISEVGDCKGNTLQKIPKKSKEKSLFDM